MWRSAESFRARGQIKKKKSINTSVFTVQLYICQLTRVNTSRLTVKTSSWFVFFIVYPSCAIFNF